MKRHRTFIFAGVGVVLLLAGCSSQSQPAKKVSFDQNDPGYKVYAQSCAGCHGADLQGGAGPSLAQVGSQMSKAQIQTQIENGGGGMPGFKGRLDAQKISDVVDFLSKLK